MKENSDLIIENEEKLKKLCGEELSNEEKVDMVTASEIEGKEWQKELGEVKEAYRELLASQNQINEKENQGGMQAFAKNQETQRMISVFKHSLETLNTEITKLEDKILHRKNNLLSHSVYQW